MATLKSNFVKLLHDKYGTTLPSQEVIGSDLGISQTTVSRWISEEAPNRFDRKTIEAICNGLRVQPGQLFYMDKG